MTSEQYRLEDTPVLVGSAHLNWHVLDLRNLLSEGVDDELIDLGLSYMKRLQFS